MDVESFRASVRGEIERSRANVEAFLALSDEASFAEVIGAFDRLLAPLNGLEGLVQAYVLVHPDADMRSASEELEQDIASLRTELSLHRGVYDRLARLEPDDSVGGDERRLFEHARRDFRRSGVDRDDETRVRVKALQEELVRIGQEFDRNIITGGRDFVVRGGHADLAGLPADFLASHPEREDGSVLLSTDPADKVPVLTYATDPGLRHAYFVASANRAVPENLEVLPRLLATRHELARLLGYPSWAQYVTEDKMSGSAANARSFVERVTELARSRATAERDELLEKKRESDPGASCVHEWERMFLEDQVRNTRYGFDSQSVRPYFQYRSVRDGVLATSAALYGVDFRRNETHDVWHPAVECYDVVDGGEVVARFFLDMHARDGKYKHAAMFDFAQGIAGEVLPEAALVCNFPEPSDDDPALLLHDQVTTFFHEFGHLLHHLFAGRHTYLGFSGIATEHDFVEVPSQMYEEWAWNADVLQPFARHHETGEPIPGELVARMRAADEYGKALGVLIQMSYALLSLAYYEHDPSELDLTETMHALKREVVPLESDPENNFHASFGHLNGYSAMYYTYMWSLVIAKDLFSRFQNDLMNGATANEYRATVLAPGGSRDARDLVASFLGREYGFDAFERWLSA